MFAQDKFAPQFRPGRTAKVAAQPGTLVFVFTPTGAPSSNWTATSDGPNEACWNGNEMSAGPSIVTGVGFVLVTTFLASTVEAIEMVTIVVGVGATRGWRAALAGVGAGFLVLAVIVAAFGVALSAIPIGPLRLIVGALLLVFGLQWFRKGIVRVAARGLAGVGAEGTEEEAEWTGPGFDWTAFVLAFKGVVLEGLEVAFIVVTFGAVANQLGAALIGGVGAMVVVGALGAVLQPLVRRIPRSLLQLVVGTLLTTFGTFWALEGLGVVWPGGDAAILGLLILYVATALAYVAIERRHALGFAPGRLA
jgi:uncharacterized membrane protein